MLLWTVIKNLSRASQCYVRLFEGATMQGYMCLLMQCVLRSPAHLGGSSGCSSCYAMDTNTSFL